MSFYKVILQKTVYVNAKNKTEAEKDVLQGMYLVSDKKDIVNVTKTDITEVRKALKGGAE